MLVFDSLPNHLTEREKEKDIKITREYSSYEYQAKFKRSKTFSEMNFKHFYPSVPRQSSHSDCGIYVLQYIQKFFQASKIQN